MLSTSQQPFVANADVSHSVVVGMGTAHIFGSHAFIKRRRRDSDGEVRRDIERFLYVTIFSDSYDDLGSWGDPDDDHQISTGAFKDVRPAYPVPHHIRWNHTSTRTLPHRCRQNPSRHNCGPHFDYQYDVHQTKGRFRLGFIRGGLCRFPNVCRKRLWIPPLELRLDSMRVTTLELLLSCGKGTDVQ